MNKLLIIISFLLMSCENQEIFVNLKNHSGIGVFSRGEDEGKSFYYQSILVTDDSKDKTSLKAELLAYHSKKSNSIFLDNKIIQFSSTFYESNSKTVYFIEKGDDPGGFSSEILTDYYDEFGIAEVVTKRVKNSNEFKTEISFKK